MTIYLKRFSHRQGGEIIFSPVIKPSLNPFQIFFKLMKGVFKHA